MACQAYQASDQMVCGPCGLQWDMHDEDPPKCQNRKVKGLAKKVAKIEFSVIEASQHTIEMPLHVTLAQAFEIARIYEAQRAFGRDMTTAMQKAYDTFAATC